ncbi:MAG: 4-(cytidine 5'-diphospho)-2-C-methyl-D-erythritol kinase [Ginsengibacter sp.]
MIVFPNCKINLGLNIISKRDNGYHNIESVLFPVKLYDALEILQGNRQGAQLTVTGIPAGNTADNLCVKAYNLLKKHYPQLPGINMHLHKAIPSGAGLGGGSADAVSVLQLLDSRFSLGISQKKMQEYALDLGSDCPFFLINKPCLASGRGEVLEPLTLSLQGYKILLIHPAIHIPTATAFKQITPSIPEIKIKQAITQPIETWKGRLVNDFEKIIFTGYPEIKKIKNNLYDQGAVYASMTGSGSTVYGIFKNDLPLNFPSKHGYFYKLFDTA